MASVDKIKSEIHSIALDNGAALVGIGSRDRLDGAPRSVDPNYLLPSTKSIISFAIPLDRLVIRNFLSKREWLAHGANRKTIYQKLYRITNCITGLLEGQGFETKGVEANSVYRPEPGGTDAINRVRMVPDFSHRYAAVACGLGWLGWNGNLITPQFGSAVYLASVLTSAEMQADPLLEVNPCDKCKICTTVCPVNMISANETVSFTIAGRKYIHGKKAHNARRLIGCGGFHGLNPNGKWSTWSPFRLQYHLPDNNTDLIALVRKARSADPNRQGKRALLTQRDRCFNPNEVYLDTCGNCQIICWERREDRKTNQKLLFNSGVTVLTKEGNRVAVPADQVKEVETNRVVNVAVTNEESKTTANWLNKALSTDSRRVSIS